MSPYIRTRKFVREEWDTVLSSLFPTLPNNGWKGILMANYGIIDPVAAYNYFVDRGFDEGVLDPGTSRTWYLALVGGRFCSFLFCF
jgi:endo-1,3(4)-beta-glucanase